MKSSTMAKVEVRAGLVTTPILRNEAYSSSAWIHATAVIIQICAATNLGNMQFPLSPDKGTEFHWSKIHIRI